MVSPVKTRELCCLFLLLLVVFFYLCFQQAQQAQQAQEVQQANPKVYTNLFSFHCSLFVFSFYYGCYNRRSSHYIITLTPH